MGLKQILVFSNTSPQRIFRFGLLLAFLSGAVALIHQLLWTRRMVDLLGASGESVSRVFGSFFLGLALGAAFANWLLPRTNNPWNLAATAEFLVAITALGVVTLPHWSDGIWPVLGPGALVGWPGHLTKLVISTLAIGIPAFFMGLVLPALAEVLITKTVSMRREGIWLYAVNTLGGAIGLIGVVGFMIEWLGATNCMLVAICLNVVIGSCCLTASKLYQKEKRLTLNSEEKALTVESSEVSLWLLGLLAFVSGAGILATEGTVNQRVMLVAPLSFYAPATILFSVILALSLGAFFSPLLLQITRTLKRQTRFCAILAVSGIAIGITPFGFMAFVRHAKFLTENATLLEFVTQLAGVSILTLGPAFFIAGCIFPLVIAEVSDQGKSAGSELAKLLALNGMGGFLGAEIAYRFILPMAGPHGATGLVGVGYATVALILAFLVCHIRVVLLTCLALAVSVWMLKQVAKLPVVNPNVGFQVLAQWAGREGSVAVVKDQLGHRAILMSNQYVLGGTAAQASQELQALLPLSLHAGPSDVAFIGLATGATPGAALTNSRVESITAIEISPLVYEAATQFFSEANRYIVNDPRATVVIEDGRTYIAACRKQFDVIAGDLFLPWGSGEGRLFSVEHFRAVKLALKEGGLFCQWIPLYQLTPSQLEIIAATFQRVFPKTYVFATPPSDPRPILAFVGYQRAPVFHSTSADDVSSDLPEFIQGSHYEHLFIGEWQGQEGSRINTLSNLAIELDAGRERLTGNPGSKYLYGKRWAEYREGLLRCQPLE
ncbi:MAG: fused MFS/spermidine synthase [Verrucomicrobiota bacterium]